MSADKTNPGGRRSAEVVGDDAKPELIEHQDYYLENGCMVFTAHYHIVRGYCCGNGCRHCPYKQ